MANIDKIKYNGTVYDIASSGSTLDEIPEFLYNKTIAPIYLGDYVTVNKLPSACLKIGSKVYMFDGLRDVYDGKSNLSYVYIYYNGILQERKEVDLGHANSVSYDGTYIYVIPTWDFANRDSSGNKTNATKVYRYDVNFSTKTEISTPAHFMATTYDHVKKKLYFYGYDCYLYTYDSSGFTKSVKLNLPTNVKYIQDIAIYNDIFFLSSPHGIAVIGKLSANPKIYGMFAISAIDQDGRFKMGELEGWEFGTDGVLYAARETKIHSYMWNGFFTSIPIFKNFPPTAEISFSEVNFTLTHVDGNNKLALTEAEIRNLNQLNAMITKPNNILINSDVSDEDVVITDSVTIELQAKLKLKSLILESGLLNIYANKESNSLEIESDTIRLMRSAELCISGYIALNISRTKLNLDIGYYFPTIKIRLLPNGNKLYIVNNKVEKAGLYYGQTLVGTYSDVVSYGKRMNIKNASGTIDNTSVASGTWTCIGNITISQSAYAYVDVMVRWESNATGVRKLRISTISGEQGDTASNPSALGLMAEDASAALPSGSYTYNRISVSTKNVTQTAYYLWAWQNSGSTIIATPRFNYIEQIY